MLSFIYRLANSFEHSHGFRPNLLFISPTHYDRLREELAGVPHLEALRSLLGMEVVLDEEVVHPHVAWSAIDWRRAVAV